MFKKSMSAVMAALAVAVLVSACGGGSSSGGGGYYDPGYQSWYDVYGNRCGSTPGPGCNFYANGYKIADVEDPYFSSYYALDYATWYYTDSYGRSQRYEGWAWLSNNGILYDYYGAALNEDASEGRDHAAKVAQSELNAVQTAANVFAEKYKLEPQVALSVAKIVKDYAELGKSRARTEADIADFSQRLYGQDLNKIKGALAESMKGNRAPMENAIQETATNWKTTPETMKAILKVWHKDAGQLL